LCESCCSSQLIATTPTTSITPSREMRNSFTHGSAYLLVFDSERHSEQQHGARSRLHEFRGGKCGETFHSPRKHHETTTSSLRGKPGHGSIFHGSQQRPGCEDPGNFQIISEHSTCHRRGSRRRMHRGLGKWRKGRAAEAHGVLGLIGGNQTGKRGSRLKDGDTAVSSLFASQEGNRKRKYIDHTLPDREQPNQKWRSSTNKHYHH
jgi:hypothetical protein